MVLLSTRSHLIVNAHRTVCVRGCEPVRVRGPSAEAPSLPTSITSALAGAPAPKSLQFKVTLAPHDVIETRVLSCFEEERSIILL